MSPGYRHTAPHVTMWRDLWVRLDTGDGRLGATCSVGNTHHMTGLEGAVRAYRYAEFCRFLEHESPPLSCRVMPRLRQKSPHVAKTQEKIQKLSDWQDLGISQCESERKSEARTGFALAAT